MYLGAKIYNAWDSKDMVMALDATEPYILNVSYEKIETSSDRAITMLITTLNSILLLTFITLF